MVKALVEVLVEQGFTDTIRKAAGAIKRGEVYVNGIRVANNNAILIVVESVVIRMKDIEKTVSP